MAKTWPALPLPTDPRLLVKAPDFHTYEEQEHALNLGHFFLTKQPHAEHPIAARMMETVEVVRDIKLGEKYLLYRYPQGLAVVAPSGWTFMMPFDMKTGEQLVGATQAQPKGNPQRLGGRRKAQS